MPSKKILEEKQALVKTYLEKMKNANMIILTDYRGITVEQDTKLRAEMRKSNANYEVVKNSILKFAADEASLDGLKEYLEGPTSITFSNDYVESSKILFNFSKGKEKTFSIKAGVMDGKIITGEEVKRLATIPSKEVLYAQIAGALLGNMRNLAYAVDQIRQKQEQN